MVIRGSFHVFGISRHPLTCVLPHKAPFDITNFPKKLNISTLGIQQNLGRFDSKPGLMKTINSEEKN
ncbi:rCG59260 [Rattus norvegicus]|uniref:RCG59260 n=1 Tax=Rattus norvegicus TaxID=10116 RepID=A6K7U3_RAT|nr:rCG59260 [Rattus norvegicus]